MCREYRDEHAWGKTGRAILHDSLVINFDGKATELAGMRFEFDIDSDGKVESIPELGVGSGFLVFDRNGNGQVDNGSELFGACSGDGFAELARLVGGSNGWLGGGDPDFAGLRVWHGGGDGEALAGPGELGVGGFWLGSAATPFAIKDDTNHLLGGFVPRGSI